MSTKHTVIKNETFDVIKSAINKMVDTIKPTFGPANNKVIIDKFPYKMVVDDGVQIARDFVLENPEENAVVRLVREIAVTTNDRAGDGTTGALIMAQAIINEVSRKTKFNGRKIEKELKKGCEEAVKMLKDTAVKIETKEDLKKVAMVSFDDEEIAEIISSLYFDLGKDAIVTLGLSETLETSVEKTEGVRIDSGWLSQYMVTNPQRMETELVDANVLITDYRITESKDLIPILQKMAKAEIGNFVLIAENVEQKALAILVLNLPMITNAATGKQGTFPSIAIACPNVLNKKAYLEDLALLTGAKMFTESKGDKLENAEISDLGKIGKIIVNQDSTIIVEPKGDKADIATAISDLRLNIENEKDERKKKLLQRRLGLFTNTLAVINVGAKTDNERKALKYKIEDAVYSVQSAYRNGVVCGGGVALGAITTSSKILNEALKYPTTQLFENMGMDVPEDVFFYNNTVLNVVTGEKGNMLEVGVIDPVDVLIAGIESAVSIAGILLTSSGMIVESEKEINS